MKIDNSCRSTLTILLLASLLLTSGATAQADVVLDWNGVMNDTLLADQTFQNPGMASRTQAMMNLAIYDALFGASGQQPTFYKHAFSPASGASPEAAAAAAAHGVLSAIYPGQQAALDTQLATSLSNVADVAARTAGQTYGVAIANSIVSRRADDGFDHMVQYTPVGGIGHWTPDPLNPGQQAWGPEWGSIRPFSIARTDDHLPPPMPDITSQEYADAFNEVKDLGAKNSASRTQEQTDIGYFWAYDRLGMGTPMRMYNKILQTIAVNENNSTEDNANLFAKAAVAVADAGIVAWDAKFEYDLWRPVTGIREAALDGNPLTEADENWEPLGAPGGGVVTDFTPPFPTYISGHATFGGALFQSLYNFYGTDALSFDVTSDEMPGMMRSYTSLADARMENGRSRVYLGIHWNYDDIEGQITGMNISDALFSSAFVAVPEPSTVALVSLLGGIGILAYRRRR